MNILFIGGNHKLCIEFLYKLLDKKIKFNIVILDNQQKQYIQNETINYHFEYLKGDVYDYYYGSFENRELLYNICKKHNIDVIINNVKYKTNCSFEDNYNTLINGYYNVLKTTKELNINKIINIRRLYLNDYYNLQKISNLKQYIHFFNIHNQELECLMGLHNIVFNIDYYDNLYYNSTYEFSNNLIEKYIYSFKIGDKPFIQNINSYFVSSDNIINSIINCIKNKDQSLNHVIYGIKINIQYELIPTLINYIKIQYPEIKCNCHYECINPTNKNKPIIFDDLNKAIAQSIKNIFT